MTAIKKIFKRIKKSIVLSIILIILLIFSIVGIVFTSSILINEEEELNAVAGADNYIVRTGEIINFNSDESRGKIKSFLWNFSDGTESDEQNPSHSFLLPGTYNVSLSVYGDNERHANTSITVWIQHLDEEVVSTRGRTWVIDPRVFRAIGQEINIGPNAMNPTVSVRIELDRPIGYFMFRIEYIIDQFSDDEEIHRIYAESGTFSGGNHVFQYSVNPTDFDVEVCTRDNTDLWAYVNVIEGEVRSISFHISTTFPMDLFEIDES